MENLFDNSIIGSALLLIIPGMLLLLLPWKLVLEFLIYPIYNLFKKL